MHFNKPCFRWRRLSGRHPRFGCNNQLTNKTPVWLPGSSGSPGSAEGLHGDDGQPCHSIAIGSAFDSAYRTTKTRSPGVLEARQLEVVPVSEKLCPSVRSCARQLVRRFRGGVGGETTSCRLVSQLYGGREPGGVGWVMSCCYVAEVLLQFQRRSWWYAAEVLLQFQTRSWCYAVEVLCNAHADLRNTCKIGCGLDLSKELGMPMKSVNCKICYWKWSLWATDKKMLRLPHADKSSKYNFSKNHNFAVAKITWSSFWGAAPVIFKGLWNIKLMCEMHLHAFTTILNFEGHKWPLKKWKERRRSTGTATLF